MNFTWRLWFSPTGVTAPHRQIYFAAQCDIFPLWENERADISAPRPTAALRPSSVWTELSIPQPSLFAQLSLFDWQLTAIERRLSVCKIKAYRVHVCNLTHSQLPACPSEKRSKVLKCVASMWFDVWPLFVPFCVTVRLTKVSLLPFSVCWSMSQPLFGNYSYQCRIGIHDHFLWKRVAAKFKFNLFSHFLLLHFIFLAVSSYCRFSVVWVLTHSLASHVLHSCATTSLWFIGLALNLQARMWTDSWHCCSLLVEALILIQPKLFCDMRMKPWSHMQHLWEETDNKVVQVAVADIFLRRQQPRCNSKLMM